jgi:hypothetical protein
MGSVELVKQLAETSHPSSSPPQAEKRRELVFNKDYQRFGIRIIRMNVVRSLPLGL